MDTGLHLCVLKQPGVGGRAFLLQSEQDAGTFFIIYSFIGLCIYIYIYAQAHALLTCS